MTFSLLGITFVRSSELNDLRAAADRHSQVQATREGDASEEPRASAAADAGRVPPIVRELIRFADGLRDLSAGARLDQPPDPVLRWAQERAVAMLDAYDVVHVEETGAFDPHRHQAVGRRDAPGPTLAHQIADTVRPGYSWHGALLRPQQVIVYASAEPSPGS